MKKLLGNLIVLTLSIVLGFILLETAYRFYLFGLDAFSIEQVNSVNALGLSDLLQRSSNPDLVFELKPNVDTYFKLVPFGDVPAAVEFGRVAAAPVNTLRQQTHRCQEISVCF